MLHRYSPANRHAVTLGQDVLDIHVKVRESSAEGTMDGLKTLRPEQNRVRVWKTVGLTVLVEHLVDGRFALLVPDLLKPALQEKFVCLRHVCPPIRGRSLVYLS